MNTKALRQESDLPARSSRVVTRRVVVGFVTSAFVGGTVGLAATPAAFAASGDVTTVVGTPATSVGDAPAGFSPDGTPASSALVSAPQGIAVDAAGNIYFADTDNAVVRMVPAKSGTYFGISMTANHVYTIAGTNPSAGGKVNNGYSGDGVPATSALLNAPKRVTLDANGDVVFSDNGNDVVRVIAAQPGSLFGVKLTTAGDIYTLAGKGQGVGGSFNDLHGVTFDSEGNLIVTDTGNERVQMIAAVSGTFYGQKFYGTGDIETIAGNGSSTFVDGAPAVSDGLNNPHDTVVDPTNGNLVIADYSDCRILVLAKSTGTFDGIAMTAGHLYSIAGTGSMGSADGPAASATFFYPNAVTVDPSGDVIVADVFNDEVRLVAEHTGSVYGQAVTAGNVYTIGGSTQRSSDSGDGGPAVAAGFGNPSDVTVDPNGNIFVTDGVDDPTTAGDGNRIREIEAGGSAISAPGVPGTPVATSGDGSVQLTWTAPTTGGAVSDYVIDQYTGSSATGPATTVDTKSTSLSFTVSGLKNGQAYTFAVHAVNSAGAGADSGPVTATPAAAATLPGAPGTLTAAPGQSTAKLSWTAPTTGSSPTDYVIEQYVGSSATGTPTRIDTGSTGLNYTVTGLKDGQDYTFTVVATNAKGAGPASAPVTTQPIAPPGAPGGLTATPGDGSVSLAWAAPSSGGTPTDYMVEVYKGMSASGQPVVDDLGGASRTYNVAGLTNGQAYTFEVTASDSSGVGPASAPAHATPVAPPPQSPPPQSPPPSQSPPPGAPTPPSTPPTQPGNPSDPTTSPGRSPGVPANRYWLFASDGGVFSFGGAGFYGSLGGIHLAHRVVGGVSTSDGNGYYAVASDGGVFAFGDARFYGSLGGEPIAQPIVSMAVTPSGQGYWLFARDGGVFSYGDAAFYGSLGGVPLTQPIIAARATPDGLGYYMVSADGSVYAFGDAGLYGSLWGVPLAQPIVSMAVTPSGKGYWLFARDGGVFAFGDARFHGSLGGISLDKPIVTGMSTASGDGYYLIAADGGVFAFGDAPFRGSLGGVQLVKPIVAGADLPAGA